MRYRPAFAAAIIAACMILPGAALAQVEPTITLPAIVMPADGTVDLAPVVSPAFVVANSLVDTLIDVLWLVAVAVLGRFGIKAAVINMAGTKLKEAAVNALKDELGKLEKAWLEPGRMRIDVRNKVVATVAAYIIQQMPWLKWAAWMSDEGIRKMVDRTFGSLVFDQSRTILVEGEGLSNASSTAQAVASSVAAVSNPNLPGGVV